MAPPTIFLHIMAEKKENYNRFVSVGYFLEGSFAASRKQELISLSKQREMFRG